MYVATCRDIRKKCRISPTAEWLRVHNCVSAGTAIQLKFCKAFLFIINALRRVDCGGVSACNTQMFMALTKAQILGLYVALHSYGYIAGLDYVDTDVIDACDKLQVISRYGAGVDRVDIEAARARGIAVCNTPAANAQAVADLTLGLLLSVARKIPRLDASACAGGWVRSTSVY